MRDKKLVSETFANLFDTLNISLIKSNNVISQKFKFFTIEYLNFVSSFLLNTWGAIGLFSDTVRAILQVEI